MSWLPASLMVLAVALALGFAWYERSHPSARVLALVGALAALAVVGRIAFAAVPNVKPTTDIVLFSGYALGGAPGFAVGALAALVSNFFFGQGPWTPWQMAAWGGVGLLGAALGRVARGRELGRVPLAIACGVAGLFFGAGDGPVPVDARRAAHARRLRRGVGALARVQHRARGRQRGLLPADRARVRARAAALPAPVRGRVGRCPRTRPRWRRSVVALLVGASALAQPPTARAAASTARAVTYLENAQNGDGGFGGAPGQGSTQLHSGWVALGLASAGRNPREVQQRRQLGHRLPARRGRLAERHRASSSARSSCCARRASTPRDWSGRDLVAELERRRKSNGSFGTINWTAFGIMALRASGAGTPSGSVSYLVKQQNGDGGYGFSPAATSDADDTGAVLQGLAAGGKRSSPAARRAVAYLKRTQHTDGGWGQMPSQPSNAQSTAWAVQGLVAAGTQPGAVQARRPLAHAVPGARCSGATGRSATRSARRRRRCG